MCAAASSMASGIPSSFRQTSVTAVAFWGELKADSSIASAPRKGAPHRSASALRKRGGSCVGTEREGTRQTTSPSTSKVSRLVLQDPQVCARIQERICKMGHRVCKVLASRISAAFLCRASVSVSMSGRPGCSRFHRPGYRLRNQPFLRERRKLHQPHLSW